MTERSIFLAALDIVDTDRRADFVANACGNDMSLQSQVEQLLKAHEQPGGFMQRSAPALVSTIDGQPAEAVGTIVGPYKLLEQIGEGGFGVVYLAEQTDPVRRKVALKVLKPGMDTKQVVARFEAERQALALMEHPNIAKILDGGVNGRGRPYFVMELVRGIPVTDYCDRARMGVRERLGLFVQICQAVQHAHQKGIIHRDLKPSNVLVTEHDGTPVIKVIDFGVAKATGQHLTEKTVYTRFLQLVGSPLYMSPEQAGLSGLDVDTRADIYALGVILYELLTGTTPFDKERFQTAGYDEVRQIIREEEPPRPSTRLSTLGQAATTVSANRGIEPRKLSSLFRGELDWVVMKALEKDRNRRYETAAAFAADLQRYLNDEPVLAYPPSAAYRFRKFARRHKGPVFAGTLVLAILVAGIVATSWSLVRAWDAEKLARDRLDEISRQKEQADLAKEQANAARRGAEVDAADLKAISDFLREDVLAPSGIAPVQVMDRNVTLREILERATQRIAGRFDDRPLVEASIRETIGSTYMQAGVYAAAEPHCRRAYELRNRYLGAEHQHTLHSKYQYALAAWGAGKVGTAEEQLNGLLATAWCKTAPEHRLTVAAKELLAGVHRARGRTEEEKALRVQHLESVRRQPKPSMNELAGALRDLGECLVRRHEFVEAEPVLRESVDLWLLFDASCFDVLRTKHQLGLTLFRQKKFDEAARFLRDAYAGLVANWRQKGPNLAQHFLPMFREDLLRLYEEMGQREQAAKLRKEIAEQIEPRVK
jgi:serine/threonine protein kinase